LIQVGKFHFAIVDSWFVKGLNHYRWTPKVWRRCVYAVTDIGKGENKRRLNMHRLIARTPFGMVCHHVNGNTLDNRRCNLINMTKKAHNQYHANNHIKIKFEKTTTEIPENQHNQIFNDFNMGCC